jgi:hypothetical protein
LLLLLLGLSSSFVLCAHIIVPIVWHWRHGDRASFKDIGVPVPGGWRAFYNAKGNLIIEKMTPLYIRADSNTVTVEEFNWPAGRPYDAERWRNIRIETISGHGYQYENDHNFYVGQDIAYCLQFDRIQDQNDVRGVCDIPARHLSFDFFGSPNDWFEFYPIVRGITVSQSVATQP